ncbi:hypothetical protein BLNAU_22654 [Blattamonas nauphoetae]|uniref:Uncharacterized protein n=1 Tax=Blattamonas nauphoetae TaxID=2049346 RepID=A0ABQ9WSF6_9EUKA|nr:hypothetical protein BLNAU_22654 [Blattamonas nauphoetae]
MQASCWGERRSRREELGTVRRTVLLGFLRDPLPEDATQKQCGALKKRFGGDFILWDGSMWKGGEFKPEGTNKKCDQVGQTAAIRVNMRTREARLFVDDEEQPGIFTDIPSPLCLGITTGFQTANLSIEVIWLKRRRNDELERATLEERRTHRLDFEKLKLQLADLPIWVGTESLQTLDTTAHTLTPTTLTQFIVTPKDNPWRTAFTRPIDEGEWELKIRASESTFSNVMLGFVEHPLPENATQNQCGYLGNGSGGDFILWNGSMWRSGKEFKPAGTNKSCTQIGQTTAIRVNMRTREARLFVDDEEQPGIFTDIPSPLCLGITTGSLNEKHTVEVLWLKRQRNDELERSVFEEKRTQILESKKLKQQLAGLPIWVGTTSLQTLDRTAHKLAATTLTQFIVTPKDNPWRTAFTHPIDEGEWELKIRASENTFWAVMLGFLTHPLPADATKYLCGYLGNGSGGDFILWNGSMWRSGKEFKPAGTNNKCDRIGQTAAIRVNMRTREARLFVDDEEQPGIFTDIPSPLSLGITTGFQTANLSIDVLWLKRRRNDELERATLEERRTQKLIIEKLKLKLADLPIWVGTESLQTLDRSAHTLTPTTLTQFIVTPKDNPWRTAFTRPIDEGEWELKIRASESTFMNVNLGFLRHPLPENATQHPCGKWSNGIGGDFTLWNGGMWHTAKYVEPVGTNKKCDQVGQTAAIRVNMRRREARLVVDDVEQPRIFTDIPSPLCLGITTGFDVENLSIEVLWLKQRRI